jgi:hypothetical protein
MKAFAKLVLIACCAFVTIVVVGIIVTANSSSRESHSPNTTSSDATNTNNEASPSATYSDGYNPESAEILLPYELSKNPYKWKGQSGILDTLNTSFVMPNGSVMQMGTGIGSIKFDKMLDEHTALYDVMTLDDGITVPDGQLAVILPDSNPPNLRQAWRVLVEGSLDGTNAFGGALTVAAVKFEEYYTPSPKPIPSESALAPAAPVSTPSQEQTIELHSSEPNGTWAPVSSTDSAIGNMSLSSLTIELANTSYPVSMQHVLSQSEAASIARMSSLQPNQSFDGRLYRTNIPASATLRNESRICSAGPAKWIITLTTSGLDRSQQLILIFFSGDSQPKFDADALARSGTLCGTYSYDRATSANTSN